MFSKFSPLCWSKYWIYFILMILFSVTSFFIILHVTSKTILREHHLQFLFPITDEMRTKDIVRIKLSPTNYSSFWIQSKRSNRTLELSRSSQTSRKNLKSCSEIPLDLHGKVNSIREAASSFQALSDELLHSNLQECGRYQPANCAPQHEIAIIVPYRDRYEHLNVFLRNLHPFLQKQRLDYTIFVIEQAGNGPFNRGMLMNVGFVEAMNVRPFDCFIFHDVDLLPEDDRNLYTCPDQPRHMSVAIDTFEYRLPYSDIFGGVSAISTEHFLMVNGFSNLFWGWGGEDDDVCRRIKMNGLKVTRYADKIARYTMLSHEKATANPHRFEELHSGRRTFRTQGLNSLEYQRITIRCCRLFTWVYVGLDAPTSADETRVEYCSHEAQDLHHA